MRALRIERVLRLILVAVYVACVVVLAWNVVRKAERDEFHRWLQVLSVAACSVTLGLSLANLRESYKRDI